MSRQSMNVTKRLLFTMITIVVTAISGLARQSMDAGMYEWSVAKLPFLREQSRDQGEKTIVRNGFVNEPFEFDNLSINGQELLQARFRVSSGMTTPRQPIRATSKTEASSGKVNDWLEGLSFTLQNKTGNRIIYIHLGLLFPETGSSWALRQYDIGIGIHPKANGDARKFGIPLSLEPGESYTFTLSQHTLGLAKKFLAEGGFVFADLNIVEIKMDNVYFDDQTMWQRGSVYRPNDAVLGGYEKINQHEK